MLVLCGGVGGDGDGEEDDDYVVVFVFPRYQQTTLRTHATAVCFPMVASPGAAKPPPSNPQLDNRLPPLLRGETGAGVLPNTRLTPNWGGGLDLETVSTKHKRLTMTVMVDDNDDGDDDGVELGVSKLIDDHPADVFRVGARSVFYGSGHMGRHRPIYESSGLELPFWGCWRPILWEH